jgi:iduronate 2-sulfatase
MRVLKWILLLLLGVSLIATADKKPNIIWIEADDLMPRFMNKLGEGFGHTPNLDRLASRGVYFKNAVAQGPMCGPSRNGLLTNLYSHNLGFYRNGHLWRLPDGVWTFPPVLKQAGYETAYVGKSHIKPTKENRKDSKDEALRKHGFDYVVCTGERHAMWKALKENKDISDIPFVQHLKERGKYEQFCRDNKGRGKRSTMDEDVDYLDGFATKVAVDWLTEGRDESRPFFMWFNFCLPHGPYDVPDQWYEIAEECDIPDPKTDSFGHDVPEPLLVDNRPIKGKADNAKNRLGEVANVAFMDAMVGELLGALEQSGELGNTVIIFFSDHSIFLGNHGREEKATLFEEALSTSMIVSWPKRFPQDQVNPHPVELLDLIPTTFDLAGVPDPNETAKNGYSLLPVLAENRSNGREYAFSEILDAQSATDSRYRYIVCQDEEFLYDHETDPYEMENVAKEFPEVTAQMRKAVEEWMQNTGPVLPPKTH